MKRVNIECAVVAAMALAWPIYQEMNLEAHYGGVASTFPTLKEVATVCLVPVCYLSAAVVFDIFNRDFDLRRVPSWAVISILGSLLLAPVYIRQFSIEPDYFAKVPFVFSIYTALFTAPIYYSGSIVSLLKKLRRRLASGLKSLRKPE